MPTINAAIQDFLLEQKARLNSAKTIKDYSEKLQMWATFAGDEIALAHITTKQKPLQLGAF